MKITKRQLKKLIREAMQLEMFDTGSAGDESGGSSLEQKKSQCKLAGGTWIAGDGSDDYGHCSKPIEEVADDHYEWRHQEDQKDLKDHRADVVFEIIEAQQGLSGKEIVDVALKNSVFGGASAKEVYATLDDLIYFQDVVFDAEEDAWYILGSPESQSFINEFFSKKKDPEEYHQAFLDAGYTERNIRAAIPNLAKSLSDNKVDLDDVVIVIKKLLQSPKDHIAGIPGGKAIYKELRKMGAIK